MFMKVTDLTKMVYIVQIDEVVKETEKAILVAIADKDYWIPKSSCKYQHTPSKKQWRLVLPSWYQGDILAKAQNGHYINNVIVESLEELLKNTK